MIVTTILLFMLVFIASLVRNTRVCDVRLYYLYNNYSVYKQLPSYEDMLYNPKYWLRWTVKQWAN